MPVLLLVVESAAWEPFMTLVVSPLQPGLRRRLSLALLWEAPLQVLSVGVLRPLMHEICLILSGGIIVKVGGLDSDKYLKY